jgi:hypothetical protein
MPLERAAAAVLACGPGGALSHASAMTLWGFWNRWDAPFEVTVVADRRPKGIRAHRSTTLTRADVRTHLGIRVTSPARTLLDTAPRLTPRSLNRAVKQALVSPWLTDHQLADTIARNPHHPGAKLLAPYANTQLTHPGLEHDFLDFCKRHNLPTPQTNVRVAGYTVDAYFPNHRLIVELDSHAYHLNPVSFETDRDRDTDTLKAGIATVRITHDRITATPDKEAERLRTIIAQRHNAEPRSPK